MSNPPLLPRAGAAAPASDFELDRRRLCGLALAGLIVAGALPLARRNEAPRIVIRDGWILLETDL